MLRREDLHNLSQHVGLSTSDRILASTFSGNDDPSRFCLGGESVSAVLLGSAVHRRCRWIIGGSVAALHRRKRESAALRQSATAESASRVLLPSMPVAMPNIKDQTLQSFLSCQLTVIVPDLANQLYFIFIIDWACTICAANSPFRKPAWFSTCTLRRLAF